jgi:hypothetical protein
LLSLDFDGVLHPLDAAYAVNDSRLPARQLFAVGLFCHCQALEDLLERHDSVELIVHSSWRFNDSPNRMRELLGPLGHRLRAVTPSQIQDREASILDVLRRRRVPRSALVVLDDQAELFRELRNLVVACPPAKGVVAVMPQVDQALRRAQPTSRRSE